MDLAHGTTATWDPWCHFAPARVHAETLPVTTRAKRRLPERHSVCFPLYRAFSAGVNNLRRQLGAAPLGHSPCLLRLTGNSCTAYTGNWQVKTTMAPGIAHIRLQDRATHKSIRHHLTRSPCSPSTRGSHRTLLGHTTSSVPPVILPRNSAQSALGSRYPPCSHMNRSGASDFGTMFPIAFPWQLTRLQ